MRRSDDLRPRIRREAASWEPQVRFFGRRYRTITFNARGYPPSDVLEDPAAYSQVQTVEDIRGVLDHLKIDKAHVVGLSMGGLPTSTTLAVFTVASAAPTAPMRPLVSTRNPDAQDHGFKLKHYSFLSFLWEWVSLKLADTHS